MCRYGFKTYKEHFVCFRCRKQFKRPPIEDVLAMQGRLELYHQFLPFFLDPAERGALERSSGTSFDRVRADHVELVPRCPDCRNTMADVGLDFTPPRRLDVRSWRCLERIHQMGHAWHTCGCNGPGFIPTDAVGFGEYMRRRAAVTTATRGARR
jgi:hypothetical protein